jgi:hypothetical protein
MSISVTSHIVIDRVALIVLGAASAVALWALGDNWRNPDLSQALFLALFSFVLVFAAVGLALAGPLRLSRALLGALGLAIPVTALMSLAGYRYEVATDVLDQPILLSVSVTLVFFATPFVMVGLQDRARVLSYPALFEAAWGLTVRYFIAWGFVAGFWILAFLSDALLRLVQINVIQQILDTEWLVFGLSGAMLGLGLAVIYELRETVSPFVLLRLLRLMVPLVLAVVSVFLLAIPFRGLDQVFGEFSSAATLMSAAIVAITLICTALERCDAQMVQSAGLRLATRALAMLLPLLTGLALYAVVLRVRQHGWTPDRVLAASAALFLLTYALAYAGAALSANRWSRMIRRVNVGMALVVISVLCLWLTPVLNADRISARNQVNRFLLGQSEVDDLPLWSMAHEWGKSGLAGLDRLAAEAPAETREDVEQRIAQVHLQTDKYRFEQALVDQRAPEDIADLVALMPVQPEGNALTADMLLDLPDYRRTQWLAGCRRAVPDGRPGCVMVWAQFLPSSGDQAIILFLDETGRVRANFALMAADRTISVREVYDPVSSSWPVLPVSALIDALDGRYEIRPRGGQALHLGGQILEPGQ